jgi:hypothetical protein
MRKHGQTPEAISTNGGGSFRPSESVGLERFAFAVSCSTFMMR